MAQGLKKWFQEKWVDIGSPKEGMVKYQECGRKSASSSNRKVPEMRTTCKSHTDERFAKGECCQKKTVSPKHWP
jgi:hypothetical protein